MRPYAIGLSLMCVFASALAAHAIVGVAGQASREIAGHVVEIKTRGSPSFCGATMVAPDLLLTAAHCLRFRERYSAGARGRYIRVTDLEQHPDFDPNPAHISERTADVALARLARPLPDTTPVQISMRTHFQGGDRFIFAGHGGSWPALKATELIAERDASSRRLRLITPRGVRVCVGDSGGPVFEMVENRPLLVAVMSAMPAPSRPTRTGARCSDQSVATLLWPMRGWIKAAAAELGAPLLGP